MTCLSRTVENLDSCATSRLSVFLRWVRSQDAALSQETWSSCQDWLYNVQVSGHHTEV